MLERSGLSISVLMIVMAINVIAVAVSAQAIDVASLENIHIVFFLSVLFYWVIHDPRHVPLWFIFLGGLFIDFTLDGLLGLHAFGFIVLYMILFRFRRIILSQPLFYHWLFFMLAATSFEILRWILLSLLTLSFWPVMPVVIAIVINAVAFFPIILVLKGVHRVISDNGRHPL